MPMLKTAALIRDDDIMTMCLSKSQDDEHEDVSSKSQDTRVCTVDSLNCDSDTRTTLLKLILERRKILGQDVL